MFEGSRLSYVVPGYTGYIPKVVQNDPVQIQKEEPKYQIPGYAGYIPSQKSENMFGKTYGKITYTLSTSEYHQGQDVSPEERYTSMQQNTYVDQQKVLQRTAAEIVGVPNHKSEYVVEQDQVQNNIFWGQNENQDQEEQAQQQQVQGQQVAGANKPQSYVDNVKNFYGDNQKQTLKLNEPLPGYTGVNKRVQAANIFGQTYANARRTAQQDQTNIEFEKTQNFKKQATAHPPLKK